MQEVRVVGRFVDKDRNPVAGRVKFIPNQIWIEDEDGNTYPTLAPEAELVDGKVDVMVTRTDVGLPWHYTLECPSGTWIVHFAGDGPFQLADLISRRFA